MKIGAMNHPRENIYEEIKWMGENKFDFIDLTYEPPTYLDFDVQRIERALSKYNMEAVGHTSYTLPAVYPIRSIREASIGEIKAAAEFFVKLGIDKMNIHPFTYGSYGTIEEKNREMLKVLLEVGKFCRKIGIKLMLENSSSINNPHIFQDLLKEVPNLYIHLDIGHCNIGNDPVELVEEFFSCCKDRIIHLHMHDNRGQSDEHRPLGCGTVNWEEIIRLLKKYHYDDTITLEVFCSDIDYLLMSRQKLREWWSS